MKGQAFLTELITVTMILFLIIGIIILNTITNGAIFGGSASLRIGSDRSGIISERVIPVPPFYAHIAEFPSVMTHMQTADMVLEDCTDCTVPAMQGFVYDAYMDTHSEISGSLRIKTCHTEHECMRALPYENANRGGLTTYAVPADGRERLTGIELPHEMLYGTQLISLSRISSYVYLAHPTDTLPLLIAYTDAAGVTLRHYGEEP